MNAVDPNNVETSAVPKILRRRLSEHPGYSYLLRFPETPDADKLLVVVHGIARQADYMIATREILVGRPRIPNS